MALDREAKRKAFEEILEMAKGGMGDALKAKSGKLKAVAIKVSPKDEEKCPECEEGDCEEHGGEEYKSKLASLYEQMTEE